MSVSHFYSIHRDSRRGSGVLPEMIFNGGNTNLGFTTNMPLLSLPYKNSLSTWTVCSSIFQLACMLIRDSQRLPGILGAPQVLSLLRIGYRCYRCLTSFQGRLLTWPNLLIQDPALHFEFSLRTVLHDCSDFEQGEEGFLTHLEVLNQSQRTNWCLSMTFASQWSRIIFPLFRELSIMCSPSEA